MRTNKILYFTSDKNKYDSFTQKHAQELTDALYQGTPVVFVDPFDGTTPKLRTTNDLAFYLNDTSDNLSDLIVIVDKSIIQPKGEAKNLRRIIIEYPDVKFLFDSNPKWALFNKFDIVPEVRDDSVSTDVCKVAFELLRKSSEHRKVKDEFVCNLCDYNCSCYNQSRPFSLRVIERIKSLFRIRKGDENSVLVAQAWELLKKAIKKDEAILSNIMVTRKSLIRRIAVDYVDFSFITIPSDKDSANFILSIVQGRDNLFDASNLRYAIKQWKYADLDVHAQNLRAVQESRRDYLAICVEEERGQNRFNSYALFSNGYRVLPIISASELKWVNDNYDAVQPKLLLRDYDLQFPDQHVIKSADIKPIDQIRGFRFHEDKNEWEVFFQNSDCWSNFYLLPSDDSQNMSSKIPILFVSKGGKHIRITEQSAQIFHGKRVQNSSYCIKKRYGKLTLYLPGIPKPISGLHLPFYNVNQVRSRYYASRKHKRGYMNTSRQGHEHGTSLDIYSLVKSILGRAKKYYDRGKYIHAAILSNEAIEYLNGFHQALMVEAYYINAISENAISLDAMGVDEVKLSEDAAFRVQKIRQDIKRIYAQKGLSNKEISRVSRNALNQIYSDCRTFCRDREHFKAEEVFISAMGHLNERFFSI